MWTSPEGTMISLERYITLVNFHSRAHPASRQRPNSARDNRVSLIPLRRWDHTCPTLQRGAPHTVPIDIAHLEQQLLGMSVAEAPGRGFCDAIAELARTNRIHQLRGVLPEVVYEELRVRYRQNPAAFVSGWHKLAHEMRQGFIQHARQRLTSLTRLQQARTSTLAWQEIQCALDAQQNDLLRAAFALELLELVEPAVARATQLRRNRPLPR
jgi:hypothetical protein